MKLKYFKGGSAVEVRCPDAPKPPRPKQLEGKRGVINGLSPHASGRLRWQCAQVNLEALKRCFFGTLTIPVDEFQRWGITDDDRWAKFSKVFDRYRQRLRRRFPRLGVVYAIEPTEQLVPHLHAVYYWRRDDAKAPTVKDFRAWNDDAWASSVNGKSGTRYDDTARVGCRIEKTRILQATVGYLSGYISKGEMKRRWAKLKGVKTGRAWGIHNREAIPVEAVEVEVSIPAGKAVNRWCRRSADANRPRLEALEVIEAATSDQVDAMIFESLGMHMLDDDAGKLDPDESRRLHREISKRRKSLQASGLRTLAGHEVKQLQADLSEGRFCRVCGCSGSATNPGKCKTCDRTVRLNDIEEASDGAFRVRRLNVAERFPHVQRAFDFDRRRFKQLQAMFARDFGIFIKPRRWKTRGHITAHRPEVVEVTEKNGTHIEQRVFIPDEERERLGIPIEVYNRQQVRFKLRTPRLIQKLIALAEANHADRQKLESTLPI